MIMYIRMQLSEFMGKLKKYIKQCVQLRISYFIIRSIISHPMEAIGTTEKLLDELVVGEFGDVGCSHS